MTEHIIAAIIVEVCILLAPLLLRRIAWVEAWLLGRLLPNAAGLEFTVADELEVHNPLVAVWRALGLIVNLPCTAVLQHLAERDSPTAQPGHVDTAVRFSVSKGSAGATGRTETRASVHVEVAEQKIFPAGVQATVTVTAPPDGAPH